MSIYRSEIEELCGTSNGKEVIYLSRVSILGLTSQYLLCPVCLYLNSAYVSLIVHDM